MPTIPLIDVAAGNGELQREIEAAIHEVVADGRFVGGPVVEAFERAFAAFCSTRHAIGVANGTDALEIGLGSLGIGAGDEVIVPALTFAATAEAVCNVGAQPVIVDVRPDDYTLDPDLAETAITSRTAAMIAVHLYGQTADLGKLGAVAERHELALVEDAAQAHGAEWNGRPVGSVGSVGCFSFYPSKNLGAMGDAGIVVTSDGVVARRARALRHHGQTERDHHELVGRSSRLDAFQAAVLAVKLDHLAQWNESRRALAARYTSGLVGLDGISAPAVRLGADHVYHLYVIRVHSDPPEDRRVELQRYLAERGIESRVHYPAALHLLPAFEGLEAESGAPIAERLGREVLSLPMYPQLSADDVDRVCEAIRRFCAEASPAAGELSKPSAASS